MSKFDLCDHEYVKLRVLQYVWQKLADCMQKNLHAAIVVIIIIIIILT